MVIPTRWIRAYGVDNGREIEEVMRYMLAQHPGRDIDIRAIKRYGQENGPEVRDVLNFMVREYRRKMVRTTT